MALNGSWRFKINLNFKLRQMYSKCICFVNEKNFISISKISSINNFLETLSLSVSLFLIFEYSCAFFENFNRDNKKLDMCHVLIVSFKKQNLQNWLFKIFHWQLLSMKKVKFLIIRIWLSITFRSLDLLLV